MPIENSENQRELTTKQSGEVDISKQEWFQKLNPEQQKKVQDLFVNLSELQKRADVLQSTKKITGNSAKSLELALGRNPGATVDPEAKPTLVLLERWRQEFEKASTEQNWVGQKIATLTTQIQIISGVVTEAENAPQKNEKLSISPEKLSKISNAEFLATPADERLRYISKGNIESTDITSGKIKEVEFTFTFDGKYNEALYKYTTAGQVLPNEVRTVSSNWVIYERIWISGEFYTGSKRLLIEENSKIQVEKLWTKDELSNMEKENQEKFEKFLKENPKYNNDDYKETTQEIFKKWLGEKEAHIILGNDYKKLETMSLEEAEKLLVVSRYLKNGGFLDGLDNTNSLIEDIQEIVMVLKQYGKWLKYSIWEKWGVKFELNSDGIPDGLESTPWLERFTQIALSQIGTSEYSGEADKYFQETGFWNISAKNTPWCAAFVNWTLKKAWYPWTWSLAAKSFIEWAGFGHVWIKIWDKILWWNQSNKVSLTTINKPIIGYALPTENGLKIEKWIQDKKNIPDGAIIVFDRNSGHSQFS